ncbi:SWIM zinc finger family protein [Burkholderia stagnalis]|uniref:SWIM zinc finger family protein n=1 Tax=Burkholderia stagnalis TaxID=1503054 RepID=UPI00325C06B0
MEAIEFLVQGSASMPYDVIFTRENGEVTAFCSCPAGEKGTYCKHRLSLLSGIAKDVIGDNAERVLDVLSWLPGSKLEACLADLKAAEDAVESAKQAEAQAKRRLAAVMTGRDGKPAKVAAKAPEVATQSIELISNKPRSKTISRGRYPLESIDFSDSKGKIHGYAKGWYFWVHSAFQDALDIRFLESIDKEKTASLREKMCLELFGMTHSNLKKSIEMSGNKLSSSEKHRKIMGFSVSDGGVLTESANPQYEFRVTDGLESRSGTWYVQVDQTAETDGAPGSIGFKLYSRNSSSGADETGWKMRTWLSTSQNEFVELLRSGRCAVIDLHNHPEFENAATIVSSDMTHSPEAPSKVTDGN